MMQEGLARYEMSAGRTQFRGPEANVGDAIQNLLVSKQSVVADTLGSLPPRVHLPRKRAPL